MKIFAYGSNMCYTRLHNRVGSAVFVTIGKLGKHVLRLHKLSKKDNSSKADALETGNPEDYVWGVIYEIQESEKGALDQFEGLGYGYNEKIVAIDLPSGDQMEAQMYYAVPAAISINLLPYTWYMDFIIAGAQDYKLPHDYITQLQRFETQEDSDITRLELNNEIIQRHSLFRIQTLLNEFAGKPKQTKLPTYLELCKYPRHRFEEICSRLLAFYLNPQKEHGLQNLFLQSLLDILAPGKTIQIATEKLSILSEDNANGKRVDLLIYTNDFVIGIENKITAKLNNPLEVYKNRIGQFGTESVFLVVLSLRKITAADELKLMRESGFINLTFGDYFKKVKANISQYQNTSNAHYLAYCNDFMSTIENMETQSIMDTQLEDFFFDNHSSLTELIDLFGRYKQNILQIQIERITELKEKISQLTQCDKWWIWEKYDLGINNLNQQKPNIGIECEFSATRGNPLGMFNMHLTTWSLDAWSVYEKDILRQYPKGELTKEKNRAFLRLESIANNDEAMILERLKKHYEFLRELVN